ARWVKIYHPVMEVANFLNPKIAGNGLPNTYMTTISNFISKYYTHCSSTIWQQIIQYKTKNGPFDHQLAWKSVHQLDPIMWWK
ncbi:15510_t:CDS:1, partial [Gigaspora margarita]